MPRRASLLLSTSLLACGPLPFDLGETEGSSSNTGSDASSDGTTSTTGSSGIFSTTGDATVLTTTQSTSDVTSESTGTSTTTEGASSSVSGEATTTSSGSDTTTSSTGSDTTSATTETGDPTGSESSSESGEVDPTGCSWSRTVPGITPRRLATLADGTIVVVGNHGTNVVLVGFDQSGDELFNHHLDPVGYGMPANTTGVVTDVAVRGEDELVIAAGGTLVSVQPATPVVRWWQPRYSFDTPTWELWSYTQRVATSPSGEIATQGNGGNIPLVHINRVDPVDGEIIWDNAHDNHDGVEGAQAVALDDGAFGVLMATLPDGLGFPGSSIVRRYDLATGAPQPTLFGAHDDAGMHIVRLPCMEVLADGSLLAVVTGPHEYGVDVLRWSPEGELVSSADTGTSIAACEIAVDPNGGAFLLASLYQPAVSPLTDVVWRVSAQTELTPVLDDTPSTRRHISADDEGALAVLRANAAGTASVRRHCFE